jgi:hydrogenase maturation protein HypF
MSQHIGDIKYWLTYEFYTESVERFKQMFRLNVTTVVHDLHPEYFSTKFGLEYGVESIAVQHHHAHIASCMAEHGLDEKVIGIAMDGTGLGTDAKIWGGEFFVSDFNDFQRISHFEYIPLPGGDKVTEEPWRTAVSMLYKYYGNDFRNLNLDFLKSIPSDKIEVIISAIDSKLNCPESSSAGRLFDAVSALTNICSVSGFHAEAPMRLEAAIEHESDKRYEVEIGNIISFRKTIEGIVNDLLSNVSKSEIAVKFHNTVVYVILKSAENIRQNTGLNKVVMSGGSFQNAYLLAKSEQLLSEKGFVVYSHKKIPANDGGIALGQLAIAARKRKNK